MKNATIYWVGRPSQWSTILHFIVGLILVVGGIFINAILSVWMARFNFSVALPGYWISGFGVVYATWHYLVVRCIRYTVTAEQLIDESGVLNRLTDTLELYRVKDTQVLEPLLLRILGLGTVRIETSDRTTPVVLLRAVKQPKEAAGIVRELVEKMRTRKGVREID